MAGTANVSVCGPELKALTPNPAISEKTFRSRLCRFPLRMPLPGVAGPRVRVRDELPSSQEPVVPHISLGNDEAGIRSLFMYRPETAEPMCMLAEVLLRGPSTLSRGDRELIAAYVSSRNDCSYCTASHAATASAQLPEGMTLIDQVRADPQTAPVTPKLAALLRIAAAVQESGKAVRAEDVALAREAGATDLEIHDTVLIAAAFCMYNRYVDGLATAVRADQAAYTAAAQLIVNGGYMAILGQSAR
jgi:uncharacterized peroxidase-related enzyme